MTVLTVRQAWTEPGYTPGSLFESPFVELKCRPRFVEVLDVAADQRQPATSLEEFAQRLVGVLDWQLSGILGPVHLLISGGYDSRLLAALLERQKHDVLYVTDGMEPIAFEVLDILEVEERCRYVHDMDRPDPYGLTDATCAGFAPLYQQLRFMPTRPDTTLVTGLGGGEWFSYPASGWLNGKPRRLPGDDVVSMWMDCWPQYTLLPDAWVRGYEAALHPYCTPDYAHVAAACDPEWLRETPGNPPLDLVRGEMLHQVDERLLAPGWDSHIYPWNLTDEQEARIDNRYLRSWVGLTFHEDEWGMPSQMEVAPHACAMAGFATWCDQLTSQGYELVAE